MKLMIETPSTQYPIYIGDVLTQLTAYIASYSSVVVVTDQNVYDLHFETLKQVVPSLTCTYVIKPGEASKSMDEFTNIQTMLIQHRIDRQSLLLAFGGGVVGDLGGFVAATYMRGIDFIQIPTTLLAHDSAIGGKVAINHELGKNLIGAFYQPKAVIYHLPFLKTLEMKQWRSGFGEMLKHGFIANESLLHRLLDVSTLPFEDEELLVESLAVKQAIVKQDEFEKGVRAHLNFGHTLAHALEKVHPEYAHGEAVAIGIAFILFINQSPYIEKYFETLNQLGYELIIAVENIPHYMTYMTRDKKNTKHQIRLVMLESVGYPTLQNIEESVLEKQLTEFIKYAKCKVN